MPEDYVVTVRMEFDGHDPRAGAITTFSTQEIYRGSADECQHIATHLGGAYDDKHRIKSFAAEWGTLASWQRFLDEWNADE